jgi:hypothetical protein
VLDLWSFTKAEDPRSKTVFHEKKPRAANNAGPSSNFLERFEELAELFSGLFYVAASRLNSPRFVNGY